MTCALPRRPAAVALVVAAIAMPSLIMARAAPAQAATTGTGYYWKWTDGSRAAHRILAERSYGSASSLPRLLITSAPAAPGRAVVLEFARGASWETESTGRIGSDGTATLRVNPLCAAHAWCDQTIRYRLRVDGQTAGFAVEYQRRPEAADGNAFAD